MLNNKIDTGFKQIFKFNDVLSKDLCKEICDRIIGPNGEAINTEEQNPNVLPWHEGNTCSFVTWGNGLIKQEIKNYRLALADALSECFKIKLYPHFTDLVVWREGKSMPLHKDNGYEGEGRMFSPRYVSSVTYLNDDYTGGETYIQAEGRTYTNEPKTGTVVAYKSDETALHGVNTVSSGYRVTLPIWFCLLPQESEETIYADQLFQ